MEFGSFMEFHVRDGLTQGQSFDESMEHVRQAEAWGLDGVWMAESHFSPERTLLSAPLVIGAAIAGATKRLRIGTAVHLQNFTRRDFRRIIEGYFDIEVIRRPLPWTLVRARPRR